MGIKYVWILPATLALTITTGSAYADIQKMGRMASNHPMSISVVFKLRDKDKLARFIQKASQPGPQFHKFLTTEEFKARFGPKPDQVKRVMQYAKANGLQVTKRYKNGLALRLSAPAGRFERAFGIRLGDYKQSGHAGMRKRFHQPMGAVQVPDALDRSGVLAVVGFNNKYKPQPAYGHADPDRRVDITPARPGINPNPLNPLGRLTTKDVAQLYNVNPLYRRGIKGQGVTLGIATLANFRPSDAEAYWRRIGLKTKPNRITKIPLFGGGEYGGGTIESSLDVEQAGGLAPFADIRVYHAPNSYSAYLAMIHRIVSDNAVDTLSTSWGSPEIDLGERYQRAFNQAFMEAAAQGISIFVYSGDAGAYDVNWSKRANKFPAYSKVVSVSALAASPYVTAAGGTTLPFDRLYRCPANSSDNTVLPIRVTQERAWATDYFASLNQLCGLSPAQAGDFPDGGGGGVSVTFRRPFYQRGITGMHKSAPGQALIDYENSPVAVLETLPGGYAGRNVPDISMNADWNTGYIVYSTVNGGLLTRYGGTSFVAPQLNGITALFNQDNGGRLGLLNPQLYRLLRNLGDLAYGEDALFNDVTTGSNWYWHSRPGYDSATGIGTPNAAELSNLLYSVSP